MQDNWVLFPAPHELWNFSLWLMGIAQLSSCLCREDGSLSSTWVVLSWDIGGLSTCMWWSVFFLRLKGALRISGLFSRCSSLFWDCLLCELRLPWHPSCPSTISSTRGGPQASPGIPLWTTTWSLPPWSKLGDSQGLTHLSSCLSRITDLHCLASSALSITASHTLSSFKLFEDGK